MTVGKRVGAAVQRTRDIFTRRPAAARVTKAAAARLVGDGWRTEVQLGPHTLVLDMPAALGGDAAGSNPGDLIRAALAACLAQNYAMHAPRFAVEIHAVEVAVETDIDLSTAWGVETGQPPGFSAMRHTTTLTTDAPAEQVRALVAYAEVRSPSLDDLRRGLDVTGQLVIHFATTSSQDVEARHNDPHSNGEERAS